MAQRFLCIFATCCFAVLLLVTKVSAGTAFTKSDSFPGPENRETEVSNPAAPANVVAWNVSEKELPLLNFANDQLTAGLALSLVYRTDQFSFPISQVLSYDEGHRRYLLLSHSQTNAGQYVEFTATEVQNTYRATGESGLRLIDQDTMKTIVTGGGAKYIFVRYPDNEFRCAVIKHPGGPSLNFLYTANGLVLRGIVDGTGRTVAFNYNAAGINAVTQTWTADSQFQSRIWHVVDPRKIESPVRYSHAKGLKVLPTNAVVRELTPAMAASDRLLARMFGGPTAVAAGNGFEPAGLAASYPLYRGDIIDDDGIARRGHLSCALHLYGSADGTGDSPLYVPAGFTSRSAHPSPTDAVMTFYYPKLGNLTDVTLAVFHVADFEINDEGGRVRIGSIGGPGGASPIYKHSHIEFYRGNTGLPPLPARAALRIDPAQVFGIAAR